MLNLEPIAFADYLWDRIGTTGTVSGHQGRQRAL